MKTFHYAENYIAGKTMTVGDLKAKLAARAAVKGNLMNSSIGFWFCALIANLWAMSGHEDAYKGTVIYGALALFIFLVEVWRDIKRATSK